jgi:glycosyltransferase involved in cell wall biosynthesis
MAEAICRILTDQELNASYRAAALERAEQLDMEPVCREWIKVFEE